jgi:hypothetical protein
LPPGSAAEATGTFINRREVMAHEPDAAEALRNRVESNGSSTQPGRDLGNSFVTVQGKPTKTG